MYFLQWIKKNHIFRKSSKIIALKYLHISKNSHNSFWCLFTNLLIFRVHNADVSFHLKVKFQMHRTEMYIIKGNLLLDFLLDLYFLFLRFKRFTYLFRLRNRSPMLIYPELPYVAEYRLKIGKHTKCVSHSCSTKTH